MPFICRSLGVHFSKVRSLTLDTWEPELLKVSEEELLFETMYLKCSGQTERFTLPLFSLYQLMCELGNGVINQIYEARREELGARKPQPGDPR